MTDPSPKLRRKSLEALSRDAVASLRPSFTLASPFSFLIQFTISSHEFLPVAPLVGFRYCASAMCSCCVPPSMWAAVT